MSFKLFLENKQLQFDFMKIPEVSPEEVYKLKLFGPVYHGTLNHEEINDGGFKIFIGDARSGSTSHGYEIQDYWNNIPAPIHHLGYGVYFTKSKKIAKQFNYNNNYLPQYYLHVPKLEVINFGAPKTMMKYWQSNGYDMLPINKFNNIEDIRKHRIKSTINLTNTLKNKYDAVWYKGKSIFNLLDGDQICVYDTNNIFKLNLYKDFNKNKFIPGTRFLIKDSKFTGNLLAFRKTPEGYSADLFGFQPEYLLTVKLPKSSKLYIKNKYSNVIKNNLIKNHPEYIDRIINSGGTIESYIDNYINKYIENNFPDSLFDRTLNKGERIIKKDVLF